MRSKNIPIEGDVLLYQVEEHNGKPRASNAQHFPNSEISCLTIFNTLLQLKKSGNVSSLQALHKSLADNFIKRILKAESEEIKAITDSSNSNYAYEFLYEHCGPTASFGQRSHWAEIFTFLTTHSEINIFKDLPWSIIPPTIFSSQEENLAFFIESIDKEDAKKKCMENINLLLISRR